MITRITNYFDFMFAHSFLRAAISTCPFVSDVDAALTEVRSVIADSDVALLIGSENNKMVAMALLRDNTGAFMRGINTTHIYNMGSAKIRAELLCAINGFAAERGQTLVWGTDINQRPKAYERLFSAWKPRPQGTLYKYDAAEQAQ